MHRLVYGGEGGIRTHGPIARPHAFQACSLSHSDTSPRHFSRKSPPQMPTPGGVLTLAILTSIASTTAWQVCRDVQETVKHRPPCRQVRGVPSRAYLNLWRNFNSIPRIPF